MKKKIISLILVISILLSVFPVSVLTTAAEDSAIPATRDEVTKLQSDDDLEINSSAVAAKDTELAETKSTARDNRIKIFCSPYGEGYNHTTALNNATSTGYAQDRIYAWYILYDGNTGDLLNTYQDSDYAVKLAIYDPNGDLVHEYNYTGSHDANWIGIIPQMSGAYVAKATLTGDMSAEVTTTYEVSYNADISSSVSSISLNLNGTKSITPTVAISGNYPGDYGVRYQLGNSEIASAAWSGEWNENRTAITVTGKKPGTTNLTLSIYENYTGNKNIVDSISIPVTVTAGTLSVNTSNTATVSTGGDIKYYTYTPSTSGTYVIYSTGSVDTKVYLYNSSGTELDNDDDSGDGNNFRLEYNLTAGTKYTFGVKYYDSTIIGTISFKFGNVYTITYNANGGTGAPSSQVKDYGAEAILSTTVPERDGYTFLGWSTSSTATSATYQPGSAFSSNANTTLYAVWDESTYTVSYNSNGGSGAPASQTKTHGVDLVLSSTIPTRLGYTFLGWSTSNTASTATYLPGATFTSNADTTLYAVWKQTTLYISSTNTAQIDFGGQMYYYKFTPSKSGNYVMYSTGADDTRVYLYDSSGTQLSSDDDGGDGTNFRLEYDFSGGTTYFFGVRYYSPSKTGTISFKFGNVYTITYNANGGTGAPSSQEKDYGTATTLSTTVPSRSGYTFLGWSTSSTSSTAEYQPGNSFASNVDTTLYAVWDEITYTVSYNSNGGSGAPASQTKTHGVDLELSSEIPYRMGYTFLGWSTSNTASTATYLPGATFTSNSDTTLYAVWKQTILNSGSSNTAQINFEDQMCYYKFTPSKSGDYVIYSTGSADTIVCLFDENGTQLSSDDDSGESTNFRLEYELTAGTTYLFGVRYCSVIETGSISFKFGEVYTIDYIADGADIVPVGHYKDYGTDITLSDIEPERDGYIFLGWSTSSTSSTAEYQPGDTFTSNADTILYAVWEQNRELIDMSILLCTVDTCYIGDTLNVTALQLNLTYSDGTNEFVRSGYTISGFDSSTSGTKTVTVTYQGFTDTFTVTVNTPSVALSSYSNTLKKGHATTITATTTPSGQSVAWTSSDPSVATVSNGLITAKAKGTTDITAEFTYNGITYRNTCVVNCIEPVGVEIDTLPNKTVFYIGDYFERVGLRLKMLYSDGSYEHGLGVTSTSLDEVAVFLSEGTREVLVYYDEYSTSYQITVNPFYAKLLTTQANLNIGEVSQIAYETSPGDMSQLVSATWSSSNTNVARVDQNGLVTAVGVGTAEITLSIVNGGCGTTSNICTVTVSKKIDDVSIRKSPAKASYYIGDALDTSGLELLATYDDGSTEIITSGFTTSGFNSATVGTKTVTVSYQGFTDIFTVTVNTPSLALSTNSEVLEEGDTATLTATTTPSGQSITWISSDTSVATVSNGVITAKSKGTANIKAEFTYNGVKYSQVCSVTVIEEVIELTSIAVSQEPTITQYYVGDSLDTSGLKLKLTYSDGSRATVTRDFTTSGFDSSTSGTKTVTVSYQGFTDTFTVTVNTPSVVLSTDSETLEERDTATLTATTTPSGQSVTWTSSDTSVATVSNGVITAKSKGTANITAEFTYNGVKYSEVCSVTVIEEAIEITSISVYQEPTKTIYYLGDTFDRRGLMVQVHYSNGDVSLLSGGFVTSGFNSTTAGTKTIKVSYQGYTDKFTVTVNIPSIAVSPIRKALNAGDTAILTATTAPGEQSVTWTSSDPNVATVSDGKVKAVCEGTAVIRAEFTYSGVVYSQECVVTVLESILGDVDGDGKITIVDATLVQRSVAKLETLTEDQILRADTDKDGKISVMDATIIQRFVAKLIEKF